MTVRPRGPASAPDRGRDAVRARTPPWRRRAPRRARRRRPRRAARGRPPRACCARSAGARRPGAPRSARSARSTISMARSTPAQNDRGAASSTCRGPAAAAQAASAGPGQPQRAQRGDAAGHHARPQQRAVRGVRRRPGPRPRPAGRRRPAGRPTPCRRRWRRRRPAAALSAPSNMLARWRSGPRARAARPGAAAGQQRRRRAADHGPVRRRATSVATIRSPGSSAAASPPQVAGDGHRAASQPRSQLRRRGGPPSAVAGAQHLAGSPARARGAGLEPQRRASTRAGALTARSTGTAACIAAGHHPRQPAQVPAERADREDQPVQVVVDVEVAGEAGAGELRLVPAAVRRAGCRPASARRARRLALGASVPCGPPAASSASSAQAVCEAVDSPAARAVAGAPGRSGS